MSPSGAAKSCAALLLLAGGFPFALSHGFNGACIVPRVEIDGSSMTVSGISRIPGIVCPVSRNLTISSNFSGYGRAPSPAPGRFAPLGTNSSALGALRCQLGIEGSVNSGGGSYGGCPSAAWRMANLRCSGGTCPSAQLEYFYTVPPE